MYEFVLKAILHDVHVIDLNNQELSIVLQVDYEFLYVQDMFLVLLEDKL
jgi:hypothetical protein